MCSIFRLALPLALTCMGLVACDGVTTLPSSGTQAALCQEASTYVMECTGSAAPVLGDACDPVDAELLMETPCAVLQEASGLYLGQKADGSASGDISYACRWLGIGCPIDDSCFPTISEETRQELIILSDPETLTDEYDARDRIEAIAKIFEVEPDPIGMFSIVYRHITNNAVQSVEDGMYVHPEWTRQLITAFARRYMVNLHGHLTGGYVTPQWTKYYRLSRNCDVGRGRVLGVAIATHLMVDLVYALEDVESISKHEDDYILFGEVSLWVFPNLVEDTLKFYDADVSNLLKGFFFGDWVDAVKGTGTATTFIYQAVRINSWRNSQNLYAFPRWMVDADVRTGWGMAELGLAVLDGSGAL